MGWFLHLGNPLDLGMTLTFDPPRGFDLKWIQSLSHLRLRPTILRNSALQLTCSILMEVL